MAKAGRDIQPGEVFGFLTVLSRPTSSAPDPKRRARRYCRCRCACGKLMHVPAHELLSGHTRSCGWNCRQGTTSHGYARHGKQRHPVYRVWESMLRRCKSISEHNWPYYGGRGIRVCKRWQNSFESFLADMGPRPSPQHSIDRIDNDGNYEPGNCRWATVEQQQNNRGCCRFIEYDGRRQTVAQWSREFGVNKHTVRYRLDRGVPPPHAFLKRRLNRGEFISAPDGKDGE